MQATLSATQSNARQLVSRPTISQAKSEYVHRYTMEHMPNWARKPANNGKYYGPQFSSDVEWYANTKFPGEPGLHGNNKHCETSGQTWPIGTWLDSAYSPNATRGQQ